MQSTSLVYPSSTFLYGKAKAKFTSQEELDGNACLMLDLFKSHLKTFLTITSLQTSLT